MYDLVFTLKTFIYHTDYGAKVLASDSVAGIFFLEYNIYKMY